MNQEKLLQIIGMCVAGLCLPLYESERRNLAGELRELLVWSHPDADGLYELIRQAEVLHEQYDLDSVVRRCQQGEV